MEEKKHICKYCGKEFETSVKLGGHVSRCSMNPKFNETIQKIGQKKIEHAQYNIYDIQCPICGKYKQIKMSLHSYEIGKYTKTCSSECAHKLTNQNTNREELNKKISIGVKRFAQTCTKEEYDNAFKNKKRLHKIKICKYCGKEFLKILRKKSVYCCDICMKNARYEKLSMSARRRNFGGLNSETTHKYYHRGYYNNIWCDSSWELAFLVFNIENGKNIKRYEGNPREYEYKGTKRKYYPDFVVDDQIIEIKGYYSQIAKAKSEQNPDIKVLLKSDMQKYLNYTIEKYGNKFWEILYEQK